jgi:hypothetical protein
MRAVLIDQSGNVTQAVVLDPTWQDTTSPFHWTPPAGLTVVVEDNAGIGWTYASGTFSPPPQPPAPPPVILPPDPVAVLRAALLAKGVLTQADLTAASLAAAKPSV